MKNAHPINDEVSAPEQGAQIVASAGALLARKNTVRAGVLCRLLAGDTLTGLEAVFGASTTRLADAIHALARDYGWQIERTDKVVSCKDGRVQTVTEYHLRPAIIGEAMRNGAAAWCAEVRAARALLRSKAADAQRAAAQASAARSQRSAEQAQQPERDIASRPVPVFRRGGAMMKSARLDQLTAEAAKVGARINRTGDGAFVILYRGQRHLVVNLRAAKVVLRQICGSAAA